MVKSSDALRLARQAERFGRSAMPRFSEDMVVQWLVEEAVMEGLIRHEQEQERNADREARVAAAQQRVRSSLDESRRTG